MVFQLANRRRNLAKVTVAVAAIWVWGAGLFIAFISRDKSLLPLGLLCLLASCFAAVWMYRLLTTGSLDISEQRIKYTTAEFTVEAQWQDVKLAPAGWGRILGNCAYLVLQQPVITSSGWLGSGYRFSIFRPLGFNRHKRIPMGRNIWHSYSDLKEVIQRHVSDPHGVLRSC